MRRTGILLAAVGTIALAGSGSAGGMPPAERIPAPATSRRDVVPARRHKPAMVYDSRRDRFLVFGGLGPDGPLNDVWEHADGAGLEWTRVPCLGDPPPPRHGHAAIYDPEGDRLIVFGGDREGLGPGDDVWELLLSRRPTWRRLHASGIPPTPRFAHTAVFDARRHRMIVFGGYDGRFLDDVWVLALGTLPSWTRLAPAGESPPGRDAHVAIFDPRRRRMIVQGGFDGTDARSDTWSLDLDRSPAWRPLAPGIGPSPRRQHAAVYDPVDDRMLIFGGTRTGQDAGFGDVWALPLEGGAWWRLDCAGPAPSPRWGPAIGYSPEHEGLLMFAGSCASGRFADTRWLDLRDAPRWLPDPDPRPRRVVPGDDFED